MKAIVYTEYGPPDVLQLKEVEKPAPKDDEVLIKVLASSVNSLDWHFMRADPFLSRLVSGLLKPKNTILGADVAGRVEAVVKNVKQFQIGDEVIGNFFVDGLGCFAEYVCVSEDAALVQKPTSITFEEAAAVPVAALTALQGLRDHGQIKPGQKVLINGASGGVGPFAVQIAKSFGAEVTGVCSTRNLDMVRSIGADQVIDYTQEDFAQNGQHYDLIVDNVGNPPDYKRFHKRSLSPEGIYVVIAGSFSLLFVAPWMSMTGSNKIVSFTSEPNKEDLISINELIEAGKIKSIIDREYPLSEVPEAIRYLEEGHAKGKVVITV